MGVVINRCIIYYIIKKNKRSRCDELSLPILFVYFLALPSLYLPFKAKVNCMLLIIQHSLTGLMGASSRGFTETVSVLLAAKADPNITDEVKLHYSHCLYNSNLMHYVTVR
jgi:hypothetical protein